MAVPTAPKAYLTPTMPDTLTETAPISTEYVRLTTTALKTLVLRSKGTAITTITKSIAHNTAIPLVTDNWQHHRLIGPQRIIEHLGNAFEAARKAGLTLVALDQAKPILQALVVGALACNFADFILSRAVKLCKRISTRNCAHRHTQRRRKGELVPQADTSKDMIVASFFLHQIRSNPRLRELLEQAQEELEKTDGRSPGERMGIEGVMSMEEQSPREIDTLVAKAYMTIEKIRHEIMTLQKRTDDDKAELEAVYRENHNLEEDLVLAHRDLERAQRQLREQTEAHETFRSLNEETSKLLEIARRDLEKVEENRREYKELYEASRKETRELRGSLEQAEKDCEAAQQYGHQQEQLCATARTETEQLKKNLLGVQKALDDERELLRVQRDIEKVQGEELESVQRQLHHEREVRTAYGEPVFETPCPTQSDVAAARESLYERSRKGEVTPEQFRRQLHSLRTYTPKRHRSEDDDDNAQTEDRRSKSPKLDTEEIVSDIAATRDEQPAQKTSKPRSRFNLPRVSNLFKITGSPSLHISPPKMSTQTTSSQTAVSTDASGSRETQDRATSVLAPIPTTSESSLQSRLPAPALSSLRRSPRTNRSGQSSHEAPAASGSVSPAKEDSVRKTLDTLSSRQRSTSPNKNANTESRPEKATRRTHTQSQSPEKVADGTAEVARVRKARGKSPAKK